jgi:hypothetical protein
VNADVFLYVFRTWASVNYDTPLGVPEGKPLVEDVTGGELNVSASEVVLLFVK